MCSFVKATVCFMELSVCCHIIAVSLQTYIRALSVLLRLCFNFNKTI